MNDTIESLEDTLDITDDNSFVCVCNSVLCSSLGTAKYQRALFSAPKLEPTAEEPYKHSVLWKMCLPANAIGGQLFVKTGDY